MFFLLHIDIHQNQKIKTNQIYHNDHYSIFHKLFFEDYHLAFLSYRLFLHSFYQLNHVIHLQIFLHLSHYYHKYIFYLLLILNNIMQNP